MSSILNPSELYQSLSDLITEQAIWSQTTFGEDRLRGPIGPLKHLAKEANEAIESWNNVQAADNIVDLELLRMCVANYKEELADCFLLLLDAMRRSRLLSFFELVKCAYDKLQINKKRDWPKDISLTEPIEHKRN